MTNTTEQKKTMFISGKDLVAYAPVNLTIGTANVDFGTLYMFDNDRGKEHNWVHPADFRVHLRTFANVEVAITDDSRRVFLAGTQFWSEEDTYSIYSSELDVTITAPHGFEINIDEVAPAISKLLNARNIIDTAKEGNAGGNLNDDDGLHVYITVVSTRYCTDYTLFENIDSTSVKFAACDRSDLGKIDGTGYQKDDFRASFRCFMDLHHMWIYLRVLLGYTYPYVTVFNIGDSTLEWTGTPWDNDAE